MRTYFYQRAGWEDAAAYVGPNQDTQAHDITDPTNSAKIKDVSGGRRRW